MLSVLTIIKFFKLKKKKTKTKVEPHQWKDKDVAGPKTTVTRYFKATSFPSLVSDCSGCQVHSVSQNFSIL